MWYGSGMRQFNFGVDPDPDQGPDPGISFHCRLDWEMRGRFATFFLISQRIIHEIDEKLIRLFRELVFICVFN